MPPSSRDVTRLYRLPNRCIHFEKPRRPPAGASFLLSAETRHWVGFAPSIHPIYSVTLDIVSGGGLNGWKEVFFPNLREQSEPLELVLYGIFEFGKAQLSANAMQHLVQFGERIGRGDVHSGDRFCRNDQPAHRARRLGYCIQSTFFEQLGIGEKQRCIPAKEDKTRYLASVGIACDVVITLDAIGSAQHRRVGTPTSP